MQDACGKHFYGKTYTVMDRLERDAGIRKYLDVVFDELALCNLGDYLLGACLLVGAQKIPSL